MKTITGIILLSFLAAYSSAQASIINAASTAQDDVAAAIATAVDGDSVIIPAGTSTWTTGVNVSGKAIRIQGAGSGRIIGRSLSSVTVGSGAKTFTTQSGLSINIGQVLRVVRRVIQTDGNSDVSGTFVEGIVTTYSGTTLTLDITSTGGSGTYAAWYIATNPLTTINYTTTSGAAFSITPTTGNVEVSGVKFLCPAALGYALYLYDGSPSEILIHDCWFKVQPNEPAIRAETNSVVIYQCSFDSAFSAVEAIMVKWENTAGNTSWTTVDTLGDRDSNGNKNFYVEDCDFHYFLNSMNFDSNSRVVTRHCTFDNASIASHGADTSPVGTRHWEIYDNTFIIEPTTNGVVLNLNYWFFCRGGTGVVTDNVVPQIISQDWGHKGAVTMVVENIRRNAGPYSCWRTYPAPHSPGQGNNGSSGTMLVGDFTDPIHVWNNTGTGAADVGITQYEPDQCGNGELATDFTQPNRDYFFSTDSTAARPGYVKYTYPHPLHGGTPPGAPEGLHIVP